MALVTAAATWAHWRHYMVSITVAAGTAALAATAVALVLSITGMPERPDALVMSLVLTAGIGVFALAMWWDRSDRVRQTRRSDVAFWLHLLAAPMIAHPIFHLLGVTEGNDRQRRRGNGRRHLCAVRPDRAGDRPARVAGVRPRLCAVRTDPGLFREFGAVELNVALTAFVIGSALLLLSAFWQNARAVVVGLLPDNLANQLPATTRSLSPIPAS